MRFSLLFLFALLLVSATSHAQIFIETGNPNSEKYKQDNNIPNNPPATNSTTTTTTNTTTTTSTITTTTKPDTGKVATSPKTALIKIKQMSPPSIPMKPKKPASTEPASKPASTSAPKPATTTTSKPADNTIAAPAATKPSTANTTPKADNTPEYTGTLSDANDNLPPNAEVGKCYARCFVADKFDFKEEMVVDKPLTHKTQTIPATYKTVYDTVITKASYVRTDEIAAEYETITEDIMVSPATQKWVKGVANAGCLSANPADCQVMCLQQVPAVYKKVARKVVKTPAYKQDITVPAEVKIVARQVVDQPARQEQIEIPATYKKVIRKVLVRKGGYSEWKEILCGDKLTASKIIAIQQALKDKGYDPGPLDDVFGSQTKAALIKYQRDKNLPEGNLNMETLKSLGVE